MEDDEQEQLIEAARERDDKKSGVSDRVSDELIVRTLIGSGMRVSEFVHCRPQWVRADESPARISIPKHEDCECSDCTQKASEAAERRVENPNGTERFKKYTDYDSTLDEMLRKQWKPKSESGSRTIPIMDKRAVRLLVEWFDDHDEIPLTRNAVGYRVRTISDPLGFDHVVSPHICRHTYAVNAVDRGVSVEFLQRAMGHSKIQNTQVYLDVKGDRVAEKFEEAWS